MADFTVISILSNLPQAQSSVTLTNPFHQFNIIHCLAGPSPILSLESIIQYVTTQFPFLKLMWLPVQIDHEWLLNGSSWCCWRLVLVVTLACCVASVVLCCVSSKATLRGLCESGCLLLTVYREPPLAHRSLLVEECTTGTQEGEHLAVVAHVVYLRGEKKCIRQTFNSCWPC